MKKNSETPAGSAHADSRNDVPATSRQKIIRSLHARLKRWPTFLDVRVREFSEGRPDRGLARWRFNRSPDTLDKSRGFCDDGTGQQLWAEQGRQTTVADLFRGTLIRIA